ncbi:hypothetical protein ACI65C_005185 [Semiaphis heraclei]
MNGQYQITDNELYLGTKVLMHKDNPDILSNNNQRKDFFERCRQFLQTSSLEMKKRYNMADPVLTELFSFKPKNALSLEFRNTKPSLVNLIKLVLCIININDPRIQVIDDEWRRLPISISSTPDDIENMIEPDTFWWSIKKFSIENDTQEFIQLCNFALALLSLPHANADCERIFSSVNCMKTKISNEESQGNFVETANTSIVEEYGINSIPINNTNIINSTSVDISDDKLNESTECEDYDVSKIGEVKRVIFTKNSQTISLQFSFDPESEKKEVTIAQPRRRKGAKAQNYLGFENSQLNPLYKKKLPISTLKYKDLEKLCRDGVIPTRYQQEYLSMNKKDTVPDDLGETDEGDENLERYLVQD